MRWVAATLGLAAVALGGLWLLQGLDIVRIRPILCFADCAVMKGGSLTWTIVGAALAIAGAGVLLRALRRS
jgi:hypothetical protein